MSAGVSVSSFQSLVWSYPTHVSAPQLVAGITGHLTSAFGVIPSSSSVVEHIMSLDTRSRGLN
jgi:hypothetical protein